jgi:hypothetical protein
MDTSQVIVMCVLLNFLFFFFMGQFNFLGLVSLLLVSNTVLSLKEFKDCCEFGISLHFDILIGYTIFSAKCGINARLRFSLLFKFFHDT